METNEEMAQDNERCNDSSGSGGECCSSGPGGWKSLKTALFVLVILAAGALATHSVLSNGTNNSPCAAGLCPLNKACSSNKACVATEANPGNVTCPSEKKADNPSLCCPKAGAPSGCPKTEVPGCCPKTAVPSGCPNTETPSSCPKTAAVPGCCPNTGSE